MKGIPKGRLPYQTKTRRGSDWNNKKQEAANGYHFDISGTRVIGDVVVEVRGGQNFGRVGDVARSVMGGRVIR